MSNNFKFKMVKTFKIKHLFQLMLIDSIENLKSNEI
jgi:hypothetical protein